MPVVPCGLIWAQLLGTLHRVVCSPRCGRWHHVVVVSEREPTLLIAVNQSRKVHTVVVSRHLNLLLLALTFVPVEVVRPSAGSTVLPVGMIAQRSVHRGVAGYALVKSSRSQRQESSLTRTRHSSLLAVPWGVLLYIVHRTYATYYHVVIVVLFAIVHVELPVALQRTVVHLVVYVLFHRHGHTVYTYLQRYHTLRCSVYVASVWSHTSTWHTQQCRISALAHGHAQYTIGTRSPTLVLEAHLIHVHVLGATLWQQSLGGLQCRVAGIGYGLLPEILKVLRHHRRWLQLLRIECCSACTLVVLSAHMCRHVHTIETRLLHGAR